MFNRKKISEICTDEKNVTTLLTVINSKFKKGYCTSIITVAKCGWADEPKMWFVLFEANDKQMHEIMEKLLVIGNLELVDGKLHFKTRA